MAANKYDRVTSRHHEGLSYRGPGLTVAETKMHRQLARQQRDTVIRPRPVRQIYNYFAPAMTHESWFYNSETRALYVNTAAGHMRHYPKYYWEPGCNPDDEDEPLVIDELDDPANWPVPRAKRRQRRLDTLAKRAANTKQTKLLVTTTAAHEEVIEVDSDTDSDATLPADIDWDNIQNVVGSIEWRAEFE